MEPMASKSFESLREHIIDRDKKGPSKTRSSSIVRVPLNLREVDKDAFTPKVISLGPYHRNRPSLQEMENCKHICLHSFLKRITALEQSASLEKKLELCIGEMRKMESEARGCYSDRIDMGSEEFAEMMLLDGCFVLEVLRHPSELLATPSMYQLVSMDMLMLENQIPFLILVTLYGLVKDGNLEKLVSRFVEDFFPDNFYMVSGSEPRHLLHQIHSCVIPSEASGSQYQHVGKYRSKKCMSVESIPSAIQLTEAGIKIVREEDMGAPFELRYRDGVLRISQLKIYDHSRFLLRNLVALEHCYLPCGRYITDYVFFVDRLINTPGDVALLRDRGVVVNGLGSDEEAALLVNSLSRNMVWDSGNNELMEVFRGINEHCRRSRWRAKLMRRDDHFRSPLAVMLLLVACAILAFTSLQTVYTVLSYYRL